MAAITIGPQAMLIFAIIAALSGTVGYYIYAKMPKQRQASPVGPAVTDHGILKRRLRR